MEFAILKFSSFLLTFYQSHVVVQTIPVRNRWSLCFVKLHGMLWSTFVTLHHYKLSPLEKITPNITSILTACITLLSLRTNSLYCLWYFRLSNLVRAVYQLIGMAYRAVSRLSSRVKGRLVTCSYSSSNSAYDRGSTCVWYPCFHCD